MDTESLKAFLYIAESGSFSRAAKRLHLTQPAISKRIQSLELRLETRLFDRVGKISRLTPAGVQLRPRARDILRQVEDAQQTIRNLSGQVTGHLVLATNHHIGLWRLPQLLKTFSGRYRDVALDLHFMDSMLAESSILEGELEIAVITLPPTPHKNLESVALWEDVLEIVVAPDHPLAATSSITLEELAQYPAILPDLTTFTGRIVHDLFQQHQIKLITAMTTNYLETIKMLISIGLGWSVLPTIMLDDSTRVLELTNEKISRTLGYLHHRQRSLSNAGSAFLDILKEQADENPGSPAEQLNNRDL